MRSNTWLVLGLGTALAVSVAPYTPAVADEPGGCVGDIDGNRSTDVFDLIRLVSSWGFCPAEPTECPADLDGEGTVGVQDLMILVQEFGPCEEPPASTLGAGDGVKMITICHIPPGNPDARHTIIVGEPAVAAHQAHGDTIGACP